VKGTGFRVPGGTARGETETERYDRSKTVPPRAGAVLQFGWWLRA